MMDNLNQFTRWQMAALLGLGLAACDVGTSTTDASWLRAEVTQSAQTWTFDASGSFWVDGARFGVTSAGVGDAFELLRVGGGRPAVGDHAVGTMATQGGDGLAAVYVRRNAGTEERFMARSGTLHVTESASGRVSGTFHVTAARYCSTAAAAPTCGSPWAAPAGAPEVELAGSFSVTDEVAVDIPVAEEPIPADP